MPISCEMTVAILSLLAFRPSEIRCRQAARSSGGVCDQIGNADLAAATARSTSAAVPRGILPITCSVVEVMTLTVSEPVEGTHSPPIYNLSRTSLCTSSSTAPRSILLLFTADSGCDCPRAPYYGPPDEYHMTIFGCLHDFCNAYRFCM